MRITISTGIYPPKTSGPAQYAQNMAHFWSKMGHDVEVCTYGIENRLPTGIRHFYYFLKVLPRVWRSDVVFILDTFSVGLPTTLAAKLLGKKTILRTGGDFLWEGYVERTGDLVLLKDFYKTSITNFSLKEKIIFNLIKWTLNNVDLLVFSTDWQRQIFLDPYKIKIDKTLIIENHYEKIKNDTKDFDFGLPKNFVGSVRPLKWKNINLLREVFSDADLHNKGVVLDTETMNHENFLNKISNSFAVILVSLGDISPHMILDAISLNKPFILTSENGLMNRIKDIAITVNPKDKKDIKDKINWLLNEDNYKNQVDKISKFSFSRTWEDIALEYLDIFKKL
ncbi:MAG: hypothetical protein AB198_00670 [Parcubacteria bacterium C7867-003]|nr:MAG: hypothetical protein AB198_00670 [Parcubacteria bacterium C7867-003]